MQLQPWYMLQLHEINAWLCQLTQPAVNCYTQDFITGNAGFGDNFCSFLEIFAVLRQAGCTILRPATGCTSVDDIYPCE